MQRLERIDLKSLADFDRAESAGASAGVSQDHKGGNFLAPALGQVWTTRTFANGMQVFRAHHLFHVLDRVGTRQSNGQPFGQARAHLFIILLEAEGGWAVIAP